MINQYTKFVNLSHSLGKVSRHGYPLAEKRALHMCPFGADCRAMAPVATTYSSLRGAAHGGFDEGERPGAHFRARQEILRSPRLIEEWEHRRADSPDGVAHC